MRLRMYGSTETKTFRTRTSPAPGSRSSTSRNAKSDSCGAPCGRAASTTSRVMGRGRLRRLAFDLLRRLAAAAELGLHLRELVVDLAALRDLLQLAVDVVARAGDIGERSRRGELLDRARARLHLLRLVLRPLDRAADVGHVVADPARRLADPHLRLGGRVLRLDDFLLRAEGFDLRLQRALALDQLLLLRLELLALGHDVLQLALDGRLARERLAREILAVRLQRVARLAVELVDLLLHARVLELEALLRRRHVGDAALDVLKLLELLLVRVVERLVRVLGAVERLGRLRFEDEHEAGPQAGHNGSPQVGCR